MCGIRANLSLSVLFTLSVVTNAATASMSDTDVLVDANVDVQLIQSTVTLETATNVTKASQLKHKRPLAAGHHDLALRELHIAASHETVNREDQTFDIYAVGVYCMSILLMVVVVSVMFWQRGMTVVFQVVVYVCCLAFIKIAMKEVFTLDFKYPKFVTSLHLLLSSSTAFIVMARRRAVSGIAFVIPDLAELCFCILPIALMFGLSIGAENSALVYVSAAFSEVVAASNPVMSAFLTWACGLQFHCQLLAPIFVVVVGCTISIEGEVAFSLVGLCMLLFAVFCRGLKAVLQQKVLTGETRDKFDPCTLMAWTCLFSFIYMAVYSAATEGTAPVQLLLNGHGGVGLLVAILASCVIACTLNISALFVIKELGAVGMQMVSQMKSMLVVMGGMFLLSETFTYVQQIGFAIVLTGVWWFSHMKMQLNPNAKGH